MDEAWITASATAVLALFAAVQIFREFYSSRTTKHLAAKEKAFDQINRHVFDQQIVELFERWRVIKAKYQDNMIDFDSIYESYEKHKEYLRESNPSGEVRRHDYDVIVQLLNFYEQISIGIKRGTIDEQTYKEWWRTSFVLDWINSEKFVQRFRDRKQSPDTFSVYEQLARKWKVSDDEKAARER